MKINKSKIKSLSSGIDSLTDALLHCYEELGFIYETGDLLSSIARGEIREWRGMSTNFLHITLEMMNADVGWIFFVGEGKDKIEIEATSGIEKKDAKSISLPLLNQVRKETLIVNNPLQKTGEQASEKGSILIFSPFIWADNFMGAIAVGKKGFTTFNSSHIKVLSHFSRYFSSVFENARMFQEIKEAYRLSEEANKRLKAVNKMKKDFIAVTSHELNTPLSIISICLEMIQIEGKNILPEKVYDIIDTMDEGRAKLAEIIRNLCNYSWMEEGKLTPVKKYFNLHQLANKIVSDLDSVFKKRKIDCQLEIIPEFEIFGDEKMIKNLISEIILNAIKNTPDGGCIKISAQEKGKEAVVYISDNGNGIPPEERDQLFIPFHKAGDAMRHSSGNFEYKTGGIGMGLALSKRITEAHHGSIWYECPASGKGSIFAFSLSARNSSPSARKAASRKKQLYEEVEKLNS